MRSSSRRDLILSYRRAPVMWDSGCGRLRRDADGSALAGLTGAGGWIVARVVAVHGVNNTYAGPRSMAAEWVPALLDGVDLAGGTGLLDRESICCAFYGDAFRRPGRHLGAEDIEVLGSEDVSSDAEAELLQAWWQAAAESDPGVVLPDVRTLGPVQGVQAALAALAGSRFLAGTTEQLLILWLRQVRAYFTDPGLREQIQRRFSLRGRPGYQGGGGAFAGVGGGIRGAVRAPGVGGARLGHARVAAGDPEHHLGPATTGAAAGGRVLASHLAAAAHVVGQYRRSGGFRRASQAASVRCSAKAWPIGRSLTGPGCIRWPDT